MKKKIGSTVLVVLVFALLTFPLLDTFIIKADAELLVGMENNAEMPEFSMEAFYNGEYQKDFGNYFSKGFGGYRFLQRLQNEFKFRFFKEANNITVCKDNVLIYENYIQEYLGLSPEYVPSDESIAAFTDQISQIRQLAEKNGKRVVVLITPSKAGFIEDKIPAKYYQMQRYGDLEDRGVVKFKEQLTAAGIPFVCSTDILKAQEYPFPIFPDTGIHWTREAAITVYNKMADVIEAEGINMKRVVVSSRVTESEPRHTSMNNDDDLWKLMNILSKSDCEYSYPVEEDAEGIFDKPNVFFQGGSFTFTMKEILRDHNAAGNSDFLFYNMSFYDGAGNHQPVNNLLDDNIKQSLKDSDLIIIEVNEENVYDMGRGTYSSLISILSEDCAVDRNLYDTEKEYVNFGGVESYGNVRWRWANSGESSVVYKNVSEGESLNCRIWVPYSALIQQNAELVNNPASVEVYVNGELFDTVTCQEDKIFDINIPSDRLSPNNENTISFKSKYGVNSTGGSVYFQLLYAGRY